MRWRLNPARDLRWRQWGDQYIVFNAASGQTHYLSELAVLAFEALRQRPLDDAAIIQHIANQYDDFCPDDEVRAHFDTLLTSLDDLGLIEPDGL